MSKYELNLHDYWQLIQKRQLILLSVFFLVIISTVIYTNLQKTIYRALATVQWRESRPITQMLTEMIMMRSGDPLVSQARIITSRPVLEKAVIELNLAGKDATSEEINNFVRFLKSTVSTEIIPDTNIIRIYVVNEDPKIATKIANKVADVYIWQNLEDKVKEVRQVKEFLEARVSELEIKLKTEAGALANFKEKEIPLGIAVPLQTRLAQLEAKKSEILQQFTDVHPDVKDINEQISKLKEQLREMPDKELEFSRLRLNVELITNAYKFGREKLELARVAEVEKIPESSLVEPADVPIFPISPNKRLNYLLGTVIGLMLGLTATFVVEQLDTTIGTIDDIESYLKLPVFAVIPYLGRREEKNKNIIQRLWIKQSKIKDRSLRLRDQLIIYYSSSSPAYEAYRMLRTNIQAEIFKERIKGKLLLVTSSSPEEGKSITTANLAIVMAQSGLRTLLIDIDMRRSVIHKIFGLRKREPGLSDVLGGTVNSEEAIRTFTDILMGEIGFEEALKVPGLDNLNILTSGSLSTTPSELLLSVKMDALLEKLKDKYDLVLFDSPPVLVIADAVILAPKTDGVIIVYRVGRVARNVLIRTKTQLLDSGASVKGVILNNISREVERRYGYYYHYKYYGKYYGGKKRET